MKKCYIAGKIGGLSEIEWRHNFEEAKKEVLAMGMQPVSPVDLPHEHNQTWGDYMREDLTAMLACEYLYAQRNWRHSPGAEIEIQLALAVGIHIIHQPPILNGRLVSTEDVNQNAA